MEYSASIRRSFPRIHNKRSSGKLKNLIPDGKQSESLSKIKKLLKKYLDPESQKQNSIDIVEQPIKVIKRRYIQQQNHLIKSTIVKPQEKPIIFEPLTIHCKSPILRTRKLKSRAFSSRNDSSLIVQKISHSPLLVQVKTYHKKKIEHGRQNSSYNSYSELIKGLLDKIPLAN